MRDYPIYKFSEWQGLRYNNESLSRLKFSEWPVLRYNTWETNLFKVFEVTRVKVQHMRYYPAYNFSEWSGLKCGIWETTLFTSFRSGHCKGATYDRLTYLQVFWVVKIKFYHITDYSIYKCSEWPGLRYNIWQTSLFRIFRSCIRISCMVQHTRSAWNADEQNESFTFAQYYFTFVIADLLDHLSD
jgi:hypothetical protein